MDIFNRLNRKNIEDRRIDTLIGLSKGIVADGIVNQTEAEFLLSWLIQNQGNSNPIILNLLSKVAVMLEDGVLDEDESEELLSVLRKLTGEPGEIGEVAKSTTLPIDSPQPSVEFNGTIFLFTGTFAYGTRKDCHAIAESSGARVSKTVTKSLNYLVLGTYVTDSWAHETYGRKIEKAMEYQKTGCPISIITEEHWAKEIGL